MADEIQGTPLVTPEQIANQEALEAANHLPTNEELLAQEGTDGSANQENADTNKDAGDTSGSSDASADTNTVVETQEAPQIQEVADPGDFTPSDYSFEVLVYDQEGKNAKTHKIQSLEEWDTLLETEPNLGTSAAVLRAERAAQRMDRGIEHDRTRYEEEKAEYDQAVTDQKARDATTLQWQNELDFLVSKGELPVMPPEYHVSKADWSKPDIAKQPAVKAQMDLLAYFRSENAVRAKAGLQPMGSLLDAWNGYAREQEKKSQGVNRQANIAARREGAAKVAGSTPRPQTAAPRGIAIGRTGVLD